MKVRRVQNDIVEHVNSKRPGRGSKEGGYDDFKEMAEEYTCFKNYEWFHKLVSWCSSVAKVGLSQHTKHAINAALNHHDAETAENQAVLSTRLQYNTNNTPQQVHVTTDLYVVRGNETENIQIKITRAYFCCSILSYFEQRW